MANNVVKLFGSDAPDEATEDAATDNDSTVPGGGGGGDGPFDSASWMASEVKALKKHRAKRLNEQLKAAYGLTNALAAAVFIAGYIHPTILGQPLPYGLDTPGLLVIGFFLHAIGQGLLRIFTRREE